MYIIEYQGTFLTTSGNWSAEYPEARIFDNYSKAEKTYITTLETEDLNGPIELIKDYGLESEESLFCMSPGEFIQIGESEVLHYSKRMLR